MTAVCGLAKPGNNKEDETRLSQPPLRADSDLKTSQKAPLLICYTISLGCCSGAKLLIHRPVEHPSSYNLTLNACHRTRGNFLQKWHTFLSCLSHSTDGSRAALVGLSTIDILVAPCGDCPVCLGIYQLHSLTLDAQHVSTFLSVMTANNF